MPIENLTKRNDRKSIWLSQDEYSLLNSIKGIYETSHGTTDWGKFLSMVATFALGAGIIVALTSKKSDAG